MLGTATATGSFGRDTKNVFVGNSVSRVSERERATHIPRVYYYTKSVLRNKYISYYRMQCKCVRANLLLLSSVGLVVAVVITTNNNK